MKYIDEFVKVSGFKKYYDLAYGRAGAIFYNLDFMEYNALELTAFVTKQGGISKDRIIKFLKEQGERFMLSHIDRDAVTVVISTVVKRTRAEQIWAFMNAFSTYLEKNGYISSCSRCSCQEGLFCVNRNDKVKELCQSCFEFLNEAYLKKQNQKATGSYLTGSYLTGAIGAILGGLIGIIPWVLLGMLGYFNAPSGIIMALLSYKGYLRLKGKQGKGMLFIFAGVLVVFTYLGVIASDVAVAYEKFSDNGMNIFEAMAFRVKFSFLGDFADTAPLWGNFALGLLIAGFSSFAYHIKNDVEDDVEVTRL